MLQFVKETQISTASNTAESETTQIIRFSFNVLLVATCTATWDRHPNTAELARWLVPVLCDVMTMTSKSFSLP